MYMWGGRECHPLTGRSQSASLHQLDIETVPAAQLLIRQTNTPISEVAHRLGADKGTLARRVANFGIE